MFSNVRFFDVFFLGGCNLKGFDLMLLTCGRAKWRKAWPSCFTAARTTWWIEIEMQQAAMMMFRRLAVSQKKCEENTGAS